MHLSVLVVLTVYSCLKVGHVVSFPQEDNSIRDCVVEGRFPDPKYCGNYIECIGNADEGFQSITGSCKGFQYNPITKHCTMKDVIPGCLTRKGRSVLPDHDLDHVCSEGQTGFVCSDCKTMIICVNGTAYPEPCGSGHYCDNSDEFNGAVCYPGKPEECLCTKPNEFKVDKYSKNSFFFCDSMDKDPSIYRCPDDMVFDSEKQQCSNINGLPPCTENGVFVNHDDCRYYYSCIMTTAGWVNTRFSCANETNNHLMYNEVTERCEDPCLWKSEKFECESEGRFSDPLNCNQYYECIAFGNPKQFRKTLRECPNAYEWDPEARAGNGHCVSNADRVTACSPIVQNTCKVPPHLCPQIEEQGNNKIS